MYALTLSLLLFSLPVQAQEASSGLKCEADASNSKDPYAKMKKANEESVRLSVTKLGIAVGPKIPRIEMMKGLNKRLGELCAHKATLETSATEISGQTSGAETVEAGPLGCEKYNLLNTKIDTFNKVNKAYQASLARVIEEQKNASQTKVAEDYALFKPHWEKPGVIQSFRSTWGIIPSDTVNEKDRKQALISSRIIQMEEEKKLIESRQEGYNGFTKSLESLKSKCPSLIDPMKASAQRNGDEWGKLQLKPGDPGYVDPNATQQPPADQNRDPAGPDQNRGYVPPPTPDPAPVKTGNEEESWLSRNKTPLLLGAGAAAVVGGVLWYKHDQDKKKDKAKDDVISPTATATSTSTSTSTSTVARTLSVTGFPPSATTNYILPVITAEVSGSGGDEIDITVSCVSSCSLAGTLTKKTAGGKAEFTDLYFTAPHEGVQLRVSGAGLDSIASPGSFNVTQGGRQ